MDLLEIERINLLIDCSKKLKDLLINENEINFINNLIKENTDIINKYHNKSLIVTNVTKTEIGLLKSAIKKLVLAYYTGNYLIEELKKRCDNLILDDDFKSKYYLYSRNVNKAFPNSLEKALRNSLHTFIITEFYNQNKKYINNNK